MELKLRPLISDGWVIQNLLHRKSSITGNYNSVVPIECVKELGGLENTRRAIAYAGNWNIEDITVRYGKPSVWGERESKRVIIAERKGDFELLQDDPWVIKMRKEKNDNSN